MQDIISIRSSYLLVQDPERNEIFRSSIHYCDLMTSISEFSLKDTVDFYKPEFDKRNIPTRVIYHGTDKLYDPAKNPGFKLTLPLVRQIVASLVYGDCIMCVSNQTRPYELEKGTTDALIEKWNDALIEQFNRGQGLSNKAMRQNLAAIVDDFDAIERSRETKTRVGVVGEIYVKYSSLGNNGLEKFLRTQDCEYMLPGIMGFVLFKIDNRIDDCKLYGGHHLKKFVCEKLFDYCTKIQNLFCDAIKNNSHF